MLLYPIKHFAFSPQTWTSFPAPSLIRLRDESAMKHTILKDSYLRMYLEFGTSPSREPKIFNHHGLNF